MHDALANHACFCLGLMEQTHPDNPIRMESSVLTPIDNIIAIHTCGKTKKKKKSRRALFNRRNSDGVQYARTICHNKGEILCQQKGRHPHMCSACQGYRGNLRVMRWRSQQCDIPSRTAHNSYTNIRYLNVKEMEERLRNVQQQKKTMTAKIKKTRGENEERYRRKWCSTDQTRS